MGNLIQRQAIHIYVLFMIQLQNIILSVCNLSPNMETFLSFTLKIISDKNYVYKILK